MRFTYIRAKGHMANEGKDVADVRAGWVRGWEPEGAAFTSRSVPASESGHVPVP